MKTNGHADDEKGEGEGEEEQKASPPSHSPSHEGEVTFPNGTSQSEEGSKANCKETVLVSGCGICGVGVACGVTVAM